MILILVIGTESGIPQQRYCSPLPQPSSSLGAVSTGMSVASKAALIGTYMRSSAESLRNTSSLFAVSCIVDISTFEDQINQCLASPNELDEVCERTCRQLDEAGDAHMKSVNSISDTNVRAQLEACVQTFKEVSKAAVHIYLQRRIGGQPPSAVAH